MVDLSQFVYRLTDEELLEEYEELSVLNASRPGITYKQYSRFMDLEAEGFLRGLFSN